MEELIGCVHNIICHPDMPSEAYSRHECTIKGRALDGLVKIHSKNSDYRCPANVTSSWAAALRGYTSVRTRFQRAENVRLLKSFTYKCGPIWLPGA